MKHKLCHFDWSLYRLSKVGQGLRSGFCLFFQPVIRTRFYQFILALGIAFALFHCLPLMASAEPLPSFITQTEAQDFFKWGVDKIQSGNYQGAIKDFTQAIQRQADFAAAYSNRCLANIQLGNYQTAIEDCTQAVTLAPNNTEAYLNRGLAHYKLSNYQAAIEDDNQVIKLNPQEFRGYYNRGVARFVLGNHTKAIVDYNQALRQSPKFPSSVLAEIYNDRGLARFRLSDLKGALADFSQAISLNANDYRAYYNRGCVCGRQRNYTAAMRDFTVSLQFNPNNAEAYLNRGIARYELGYQQLALIDLRQAARLFALQGNTNAYQQTLQFIQALQQELVSFPESELG